MWRSFLSEWIKLRRPAMLLGGAGAIVGFAAVTVALTLNSVAEGPAEGFTLDQIVAANGLARTVASAAQFIGVVALAMFAISIAGEYSQGTLRNLLVRQPRRVRLLAGKLLALVSFTAVAVVLGEVAAVLTALVVAPSQDIATAAWFTGDGWAALGSGLGNLLLATVGWGLLGALLALLLRSPAAAVGAGLAYALPFELLVTSAWESGQPWLPGQLLGTLAQGGAVTVTYGRAALLLAVYGMVAVVAAVTLFARSDVTT
jgi:ABC-2 type transport system permease protein